MTGYVLAMERYSGERTKDVVLSWWPRESEQ